MAFVAGYYAFFLQDSYTATRSEVIEINHLKIDFQKKVSPSAIINFNSLYYSNEQFKLLDPIYLIPENRKTNYIPFSTKQKCFENVSQKRDFYNKSRVWEEYRCGIRSSLPRSFYKASPFIHSSGKSYSLLAFLLNKESNRTRNWVLDHLQYFHVSELRQIKRRVGDLGGVFDLLERLDNITLTSLTRGQGTILTKNFLLAKISYPTFFDILEYRFYDRDELDKFLKDSPFSISNFSQGRHCFYKDGELCWNYHSGHVFSLASRSAVAFLLGLILIVGLVVRLLLIKLKTQRLDDDKRRLALQVLTHEFRTPVTSLLLLTERMNKKFDSFDEDMQDCYMRISSEVFRMQRLTEMSRNYLKVLKKDKLIEFNYENVSSVKEFIEEITFNYEEKHQDNFKVIFDGEDSEFTLDTYWIQICLKNLIENAMTHGIAPVSVRTSLKKDKVCIEVQDSGECQFINLDDITGEFVKGNKSHGTGLGLNIVKKVLKEMGSDFSLSHMPTTFKITLKNAQNKKD